MPKISIVVPCYNEQAALPLFYQEITRVASEMDYAEFEFVFIDDGSKDDTLPTLRRLAAQDARVRFVSFSRNFGKEAGMLAGLEAATGDFVATMDADLQDPPALLPELYKAVTEEGYDCAATRRTTRAGEPLIRSFFARMFYKLINRISDADIVDGARLPFDAPRDGGRDPVHARIQPFFQGHFWLGWFQNQVGAVCQCRTRRGRDQVVVLEAVSVLT